MKTLEPPEGILLTVSAGMYGRHYKHWLQNFLDAMAKEDMIYWMRAGSRPKQDQSLQYVYLVIGGKIRFRCMYGGSKGPGTANFDDGRSMDAKAWIILAGPVERPPRVMKKQGFQGFRYTEKLF